MKTRSNFFIACFILIICFLIAETILWLIFPLHDKDSTRKIARNNIPGLKKQILYERNSLGFRSLSMCTAKKPPNTIRIICLGSSTTDQPTQATDDIWSAILEKELQKKFSSQRIRIEIAAMGRGGQTVVDGLLYAQNNLLNFQPDLVILLEGINDLCEYGGPRYTYKTVADKLKRRRNDFNKNENPVLWKALLYRFSQVYRRLTILKHKFELYKLMRKGDVLEWHSKNLPELRKKYRMLPYIEKLQHEPDPINEFSDGLFALVKFLRDSNIRVIILAQPVLWKTNMNFDEINTIWLSVNRPNGPVRPSTAWLEEEMSRYNNVQREIADNFKVPYVDLDKKIPKNLQYFFDDCHFTDLGNIKVANEIFSVVQKEIENVIETKNNKNSCH